MTLFARLSVAVFALVTAASCASRETNPDAAQPLEAAAPNLGPWTTAFADKAVLIADVILLEGPPDLLAHFASAQDPAIATYSTRTTPDGLLQETQVRDGYGGVDLPGQLDGWELHALRKLVVLQRFEDAPVILRARGNAYWADAASGREKRGNELAFRGDRPSPEPARPGAGRP